MSPVHRKPTSGQCYRQENVLEFLKMPYLMAQEVSLSILSEAARGDVAHRAFSSVLVREGRPNS